MIAEKLKNVRWLILMIQGAIIGTGAILPGVSGGVLCVAFGIYEPMMEFLEHPIRSFKKNSRLFAPIIIGGLIGFVLLAKLVEIFFSAYASIAMALFSGLICGTLPGLFKNTVESHSTKGWAGFIVTLAFAFVFFNVMEKGMEGSGIQPNFGWYVFCGFIWGLSMVVPGLSSSSLLLFMGLYQPMAAGIGNLDMAVCIPLGIGFLVTILAFARVMNRLLANHYAVVTKLILGFVVASTIMILPTEFAGVLDVLVSLVCFGVGFWFAHWMDNLKLESVME